MRLGDLQALAEDQRRLKRATQLANELTRLDAKRAGIIAELQGLGIEADDRDQGSGQRDKPREQVNRAAPQSGGAATVIPLTWEAAYAEARERLIGPWLDDFANGKLGGEAVESDARKRLDDYEARRRPDIEVLAHEILAGESAAEPCSRCEAAATTTVAGTRYCDAHAKAAPRLSVPLQLRVA